MKIQKISEITATLPFTEFDIIQKYRESFAGSELGRIYTQLPLKELAEKIRSHFLQTHPHENTQMFPPEGEVALMFLKSYTGQSDEGLIDMLRRQHQHADVMRHTHLSSKAHKEWQDCQCLRSRIASVLDVSELQKVLYEE